MRGKLIVIEGTDCSGKETQAKLLSKKLNEKNRVKLVNFLYSLSSEICFTSFHNYHIDE